MTREEAVEHLKEWKEVISNGHRKDVIDMAIEALHAEPNKAVPPSLADVYKWERDIALSQLEEYGIGFGEKKRDDLVDVVRCKDCKYWQAQEVGIVECSVCTRIHDMVFEMGADEFCSRGERKGGGDE